MVLLAYLMLMLNGSIVWDPGKVARPARASAGVGFDNVALLKYPHLEKINHIQSIKHKDKIHLCEINSLYGIGIV